MDSILIRTTRGPDDAAPSVAPYSTRPTPCSRGPSGPRSRKSCWAAISLLDGRAVANPFCRTADVAALLRTAAERRSPAPAAERD
jgi:hypothetical protein